MKVLFGKIIHDVAFAILVGLMSLLAQVNTLNADGFPNHSSAPIVDEQSSERLENLLLEMGYTDVGVNACVLQFRRKLSNQCPTTKSLAYWRSVDLQTLDIERIGKVQSRMHAEKKYYYFQIPPTREHYWKIAGIADFPRKMKETYPTTGWPFLFDETVPNIREAFYRQFPRGDVQNWWISETCFGESPDFQLDVDFSFDNQELLLRFRSTLIDHYNSDVCHQGRTRNDG